MSTLLLSNKGRTVIIRIANINLQYLGPKNLVRFEKINRVVNGCIYVDTLFAVENEVYIEEDYIDVAELLDEYNYNTDLILNSIESYIIVEEMKMRKTELIDKALMVSDNFALFYKIGTAGDIQILAINMARTGYSALIKFDTLAVLTSNMGNTMLKRAINAIKRNKPLIIESLEEMKVHA